MSKQTVLILACISMALLGAGCNLKKDRPLPTIPAPQAPSVEGGEKPVGIPAPTPIDTNGKSTVVDNPTGSEVKNPIVYPEEANPIRPRPVGEICDTKNAICTSSALVHSEVANTFSVTGTGIAFENTINWRIEESGKTIREGFVTADAPDIGQPGLFTIAVKDLKHTSSNVSFVIFEYSAKDGMPIHELRIPLRIK